VGSGSTKEKDRWSLLRAKEGAGRSLKRKARFGAMNRSRAKKKHSSGCDARHAASGEESGQRLQ